MIGTTLGHYKMGEQIGAGGMGEVYQATDSRLGRSVAIKVRASLNWDKTPPGPDLPRGIAERTREKYQEAFKLLTGSEEVRNA